MIIGASFDTAAENKAFAEKFGFPYPLLCDTDRNLGLAYGAADSPTAEYAKRIAYVIGPDGKVKKAWPKVDARTFVKMVLGEL